MLKSLLHHLKTKKMRKNSVKILPFVMGYVHDQYKTQKTCEN